MASVWTNPELVRHLRIELRPRRMSIAASVSLFVCLMLAMIILDSGTGSKRESYLTFYGTLVSVQAGILLLWCLSSCGQGIAQERTLKTFDFLRTTRLTSTELLWGMVFGFPAMGYFITACTLPVAVVVGIAAGISPLAIVLTYALLALTAIVLSLTGLTLSMLSNKPRGTELLVLVLFFGWPLAVSLIAFSTEATPFPALTSLAVVPSLMPFYGQPLSRAGVAIRTAPFFGVEVPLIVITVVLFLSFAVWLALILARNLKKDQEDMRMLSRWQAVAFVAYVNVLMFAVLDLRSILQSSTRNEAIQGVTIGFLAINCGILYLVGMGMLVSAERLKHWWRGRGLASAEPGGFERYWDEDSPSWLWMAAAVLAAFAVFELGTVAASRILPLKLWPIPIVQLVIVLAHVTKDVMFLQWCALTRMKRPFGQGLLFLLLYYGSILTVLALIPNAMEPGAAFFTPALAVAGKRMAVSAAGAGLQLLLVLLLLRAIEHRLERPVRIGGAMAAS